MRSLLLLSVLILNFSASAQSNFSLTNFRAGQTTYTDISGTGSVIAMTNAETGASVAPIDIGFSFNFFGTAFTQCMIHADGILKLGTTAPGPATAIATSPASTHTAVYLNTTAAFQNIIMPMFTNLVAGSTVPQFHVLTTGTAPNRVCTIQWKNLRDADNPAGGLQHQFANLEFQVQLFETTNDIAFRYGTWTPSAGSINATRRNASAGIKASSTNFLAMHRGNSLVPYTKVELFDASRYGRADNNQQPLNKNNVPNPGITYRFYGQVSNDVSLAKLYADSVVPMGKMAAGAIEVLVRNEGTAAATNVNIQLQVTGANTHNANTSIANLAAGAEQLVTFPVFDIPAKGLQTIQVSITQAEDTRPENNSLQWPQLVSQSYTHVFDATRLTTGIGYNGVAGFMALKVFGTGTRKISQIRIPFSSYRNPITLKIYEDGGAGGSPSPSEIFTTPTFLTTSEQDMVIPIIPAVTVEGDYFIVLQQQTSNNMGWGASFQTPLRLARLYNNTSGSWAPQIASTPWQVLANIYEESSTPDIGIEQLINPGCDYSANAEVRVSLRNFSNQPIDFSSTPTTITGFVQNPAGTQFPFTIQKNTGVLAAGAAEPLTVLTGYDYTPRGAHRFNARTNLTGDAESGNDSLRFSLNNSIPISSNATGPVCPLTPVTLTGVTYLASPIWQNEGINSSGASPLTISPLKTTVVKFRGIDYRGCTLEDSIIVAVTNIGLPPRPKLIFGDTILSHRNGFKDTVRIKKLGGHTIRWLGGIGTPTADSALIINQIVGLQGAQISAAYVRTSDGCSNPGDTIAYKYSIGVLQNENSTITICDTSFYDAGGATLSSGGNFTRTFLPQTPGAKVRLVLYRLDLASFASLQVFDGPNTSSPRIEALSSFQNGNTTREFIASNPDGVLTVQFQLGSSSSQGWWAGLTCYTSEVYRTAGAGNWVTASTWERRAPGGNFVPAVRPPVKGDDTVFIRHNVILSSSQPMDQIVVEEGATLGFESPGSNFISMPCYKVLPQSEFLIKGTLNISPRVQIFGSGAQMQISGRLNNFGKIDLDTVLFNGTTPQTLGDFSGASGSMRILRLDNPTGLTMGSDQTVKGIHFVRGMLNTDSENLLTISEEGGFTTGARDAAHVNGPVAVTLPFATGSRLYPIGSNGRYRPVILSNNSGSEGGNESIIVSIQEGAPTSRTLPTGISKVSELRYFRITRSGSPNASDFNITLPYLEDDGVIDPSKLTIAKDNGAGAWIDIGGTASGSVPGTISSNAFDSFSDFVLAKTDNDLLPVTWVGFTATAKNKDVLLKWQTANESNCRNYIVERSSNGHQFLAIKEVQCNNSSSSAYTHTDLQPGNGIWYYRIRQQDFDGRQMVTQVQKVTLNGNSGIEVYPNPANAFVRIAGLSGSEQIALMDASGRIVFAKTITGNILEIPVAHLPTGHYILHVKSKTRVETHKLMIVH